LSKRKHLKTHLRVGVGGPSKRGQREKGNTEIAPPSVGERKTLNRSYAMKGGKERMRKDPHKGKKVYQI